MQKSEGRSRKSGGKFIFCLLFSVLCLLASAAYSQPDTEKPSLISRIEVKGLYSISEEELLYLLELRAGSRLDRHSLSTGIKRAFLKGIFDDISVESLDKAGTSIRVTAKEKKIIGYIKINGNDHFPDRFIRKNLNINKGDRLNATKIKNCIKELNNEIINKGFPNSSVNYSIVHGKGIKAGIVINVYEGEPQIISKISISEPDDIVKSEIKFSENDIFDRTKMEALSKKAARHYKRQGYIGTALIYSYKNGILDIKLNPGKKLNITFTGNTVLQTNTLFKEVPFFEINEFSDDLLEETTARIISLYHKNGYPFAQVGPVKSVSDDNINLEFFIFEGERFRVGSIVFEGAPATRERLKDIIELKAGGYYNPDLLGPDTDNIAEFYRALGYLYMEIQEPEIKTLGTNVEIKFIINEGPQVTLSDIAINNNKNISTEEIMKHIPLKTGQPYNEADISDSRRKILELYNKKGYMDARITAEREISGAAASISFNIEEGDVSLFGKYIIIGNEYTKQKVIKREFIHRQSAPFDYSLLLQEKQGLYRLGLFSDIEIVTLDREDDKRDIIYRFKEADAGAVEFGIGYGEYEKFRGFVDISYKNLFGLNKQGSFRTELSTLEQRYIASYFEPQFWDNRDLTFRTMLLHENKKEKNIDTKEIRYRLKRDTVTTGFEKKLSDNFKTELYYDFSVVKTTDVKPDVILSREDVGTLIISGVRPGLIYDTRDNPFEPKKGVLAGVSFKIASGVLLSETDFIKALFYINTYQALSKRIVLALSLRGGGAKGFGSTRELPLVERFFLGGRTTVRGYEQDMLGPKGSDGTPTGGNAFAMGNVEFRSDIGRGFGIVTFLDGGNVWRKSEKYDITNLKFTAGLGLRYETPVGPFRVDYGYKLNKDKGDSKGEVHFSLGHAF